MNPPSGATPSPPTAAASRACPSKAPPRTPLPASALSRSNCQLLANMHKASILVLLAALTASLPAGAQSQAPAAVVSVAAEKTQFRLTLGDGRVMRSSELIGAKLIVATETGPVKVQISAVERDPDARSGDVWLHTLLVENPDGTTQNMCEAGPDGRRQGFPIASRLRPDGGTENTPPEQFDVVCSAGARAKCVRFGYRPWVPAEEELYNPGFPG